MTTILIAGVPLAGLLALMGFAWLINGLARGDFAPALVAFIIAVVAILAI